MFEANIGPNRFHPCNSANAECEPHRFMADIDAAFMQQVFNITKRQRKPDIHHHGQSDHFG